MFSCSRYKQIFLVWVVLATTILSAVTPDAVLSVTANSVTVLEQNVPSQQKFSSPTEQFLSTHPLDHIMYSMRVNGIATTDFPLFHQLIAQEKEGFFGYHGGCSDYRLFQDLIRFIIEEQLGIVIREDFHFLRIPGDEALNFDDAQDFLQVMPNQYGENFHDSIPEVRQHILSINMALFQSYDKPWDLTPRYFVQNSPWTRPDYWESIMKFAEQVGINPKDLEPIISIGRSHLPQNRGIMMQFFDESENVYLLLDTHAYVAFSGGKPFGQSPPSHYLMNNTITNYPQLRLVINNNDVLNPFSKLVIKRYDTCTEDQRQNYEEVMRSLIRELPVDHEKREALQTNLLSLWLNKQLQSSDIYNN